MRRRTLLIWGCLSVTLIAYAGFVYLDHRYRVRTMGENDLAYALNSYIVCSGGVFPKGLEDLVESRIAILGADGAVRIMHSDCWEPDGKVYGEPLPTWFQEECAISWGVDLAQLKVEGSRVVDSEGREIFLMTSSCGIDVSRAISRIFVAESRKQ